MPISNLLSNGIRFVCVLKSLQLKSLQHMYTTKRMITASTARSAKHQLLSFANFLPLDRLPNLICMNLDTGRIVTKLIVFRRLDTSNSVDPVPIGPTVRPLEPILLRHVAPRGTCHVPTPSRSHVRSNYTH